MKNEAAIKAFLWVFVASLACAPAFAGCLPKPENIPELAGISLKLEKHPNLCDPTAPTYRTIEALLVLKNLKFEGRKPGRPLSENILGDDWFGVLRRLAPQILDGSERPSCQTGTAATNLRNDPGKIFLCPRLFPSTDDPDPQTRALSLIVILMHELRHLEPGSPLHVRCRRGNWASPDPDGCDESMAAKGAYGAQAEAEVMLATMATNISTKNRIYWMQTVAGLMEIVFVHPPTKNSLATEKLLTRAIITNFPELRYDPEFLRSLESRDGIPPLPPDSPPPAPGSFSAE